MKNLIFCSVTCMTGLRESCSHIGAILFKIKAAVRAGYTKKACTDEACKWNQDFVKKIKPELIAKINFYSSNAVEKCKHKQQQYFQEHLLSQRMRILVLFRKTIKISIKSCRLSFIF